MSLALIGKAASYEFRWRRWALLRDAVATHLERGITGSRFPRFVAIGDALGRQDGVRIVAAELADEISELERALADHPIDGLVIGPATAAALYPGVRLEVARPLTRTELVQVAPIGEAKTLGEYFASMLLSFRDVCANPAEDGTVEAIDG